MRIRDLRERMLAIAREVRSDGNLIVTIFSFGFKYGIPAEADLVFDVRFIRNPFFEEGLKHLSGLDDPVRDFVLGRPETAAFLEAFLPFLGLPGAALPRRRPGLPHHRHRLHRRAASLPGHRPGRRRGARRAGAARHDAQQGHSGRRACVAGVRGG